MCHNYRFIRMLSLVLLVVVLALLGAGPAYADLYADTRYERPPSGYEGTYEWRGIAGYVYVYPWSLSSTGEHVSSLYIHHPAQGNLRHMEIGFDRYGSRQPTLFVQWNNDPYVWEDNIDDIYTVFSGSSQKLLIRNMTMGVPDANWERWIMSFNDEIVWDQLHPLTYGQAWQSAETAYLGEDNRGYFHGLKRTSKPANWVSFTDNWTKYNQDPYYDFTNVHDTYWYNQ